MPTGTISKVYQIEGRKKPGAVVFSDGQRFSTFEPGPIKAATGNEGQLAEYTTEQNGEYTNLKTLRVIGGAPVPAATPQQAARGEVIDLGTERLTKATLEVASAVRDLTTAIVKSTAFAALGGTHPIGVPGVDYGATPPITADPVAAFQAQLAASPDVGEEVAAAQFEFIRKKHKTADAQIAAAKKLLAAHGIDQP